LLRCAVAVLAATLLMAGVAQAFIYLPLMLPMRDGVNLATDFYLPGGWSGERLPTLLIRTPYDKMLMVSFGAWADNGYVVAIQDMRGRFASEGLDPVFQSDGWGALQDGFDTVNWCRSMVWSDGVVVTWGMSALGIVQYLMAGAAPPGVEGQIPAAAACDLYEHAFYPGGVFRKYDIEGWLDAQGSLFRLPEIRAHRTKDDYWEGVNLDNRLSQLGPPAFHIGGWFDLFSQGNIDAFMLYRQAGAPHQYLVMGPWSHAGFYYNVQDEMVFPENAKQYWPEGTPEPSSVFMEHALWGTLDGFEHPAVTYYIMGDVDDPGAPGNEWRTADDWPPVETEEVKLYLTPEMSLYVDEPESVDLTYLYDPTHPTPTKCGLFLLIPPGSCDLSGYDSRDDMLYFETPVLPEPVEVTGRVYLDLEVKSDRTDTDFAAFLVDVYPSKKKMQILHGILRARFRSGFDVEVPLIPNEPAVLTVDLWTTSIIFNAGHKIGLYVSSSNYPGYDANPNTGIDASPFDPPLVAVNSIVTGANSALRLPVVGDFPWEPAGDDDDDTSDDDTTDDDASDDDSSGGDSGGCGCSLGL